MKRVRYEATCPGCGKRVGAWSEEARAARIETHARNCNALKRASLVPLTLEAPAPTE